MAVNKYKVMLEKLVQAAADEAIAESLCDDGKKLLVEAAELVGIEPSDLGIEEKNGYLSIYLDNFDIPECYDSVDENKFEIKVEVKYNGKPCPVDINNIEWETGI